jgi:hypothetical protein
MSDTWTTSDVYNLLGVVLANMHMGGAVEAAAIPIEQVAATCGFAPSSLLKDCQADRVEHVQYGYSRAMTPSQVAKFLAKHTRGGELTAERISATVSDPADELAEAREATRKTAGRQRPRRAA